MKRLMISIAAFVLLVAIAAAAKAFMDTRVFQDAAIAFSSCPEWLRGWMQARSSFPLVRITDGWHGMQAIMFLSYGAAFFVGARGLTLFDSETWTWPRWWRTGLLFIILVLIRAGVHGLVFESLYPIM